MCEIILSRQMWLWKWAIRVCIFSIIFLLAVIAARWFIATTQQVEENTDKAEANKQEIVATKKIVTELAEATPTPTATPARKHYKKTTPKPLWERIFNP
jgi:uncharacterized protein YpmS